jgi:hypothetical protein
VRDVDHVNDAGGVPVDLEQVRREIAAEVRARRAAGDYPPGFERELDALFDRFAPPEASENFDVALARAEETVAVEPVIPIASRNPALLVLKRVVSKLIGWYHIWLVQQITALGATITHALRLLGGRVETLERHTGDEARVRSEGARIVPDRDDTVWESRVIDAVRGADGRVLVAECGDGTLLAAIVAAGVDAYGVEPRRAVADEAIARGLEVRADEASGHLRAVEEKGLGGVVLRGCVERLTAGELLLLADLACERLQPGARVVVCSVMPEAWGRGRTAVEADLSPGRPFHAATWRSVLEQRHCTAVDVHEVPDGYVVVATRT